VVPAWPAPISTPAVSANSSGVGQRHARQPQPVQQAAADQHAEGAEAVGQHAREDAEAAPGEVLDRIAKAKVSRLQFSTW
jgi:hypothetical protein